MRYACLLVLGAFPSYAISVSKSALSATANEQTCQPGPPTTTFRAMDRQVFLWFLAQSVARGDTVEIDWIGPEGRSPTRLPTPNCPLPDRCVF